MSVTRLIDKTRAGERRDQDDMIYYKIELIEFGARLLYNIVCFHAGDPPDARLKPIDIKIKINVDPKKECLNAHAQESYGRVSGVRSRVMGRSHC